MPLQGIDAVSVNAASEAALKDPAIRFAIVKSTEGQGWRNTAYPALKKLARDNGKLFGAYHYAWTNQDPVLEAKNFVEYSALEPGDVAVLDIERQSDLPTSGSAEIKAWWERAVRFSITWLEQVSAAIGVKPIVYVNNYWRNSLLTYATADQKAKLTSYPLWLAQPGTMGTFTANAQWGVDIHQYSFETGIDRNWYAHNEEQWVALTIPKPVVVTEPTDLDKILSAIGSLDSKFDTTTESVLDVLDSVTVLGVAFEEADIKTDTLLSSNAALAAQIETVKVALTDVSDTNYLGIKSMLIDGFAQLKTQNEEIPAVIADAVGKGLSGFSLSVTYPTKN